MEYNKQNISQCTEYLYSNIKNWSDEMCKDVWDKWLWNTDCNALPLDQCWDMNEMHTIGVLCALHESQNPSSNAIQCKTNEIFPEDEFPELTVVHLHEDKCIGEFSLRELLDQLECLQLNWGKIIGELMEIKKLDLAKYLLKACLGRLGQIAHHAYEFEGATLDDPQYITMLPETLFQAERKFAVISRKTLRQTICLLFSLFRVQHIVSCVSVLPPLHENLVQNIIHAFKQHHVESSMDFFNVFQQMIYLAPGMRLVYRTNFAGMYNDVSQVIYFHYPRFCRQPQLSLAEIPQSNIHLLPLASQLLPDVPIFYDDDTYIPGLCADAMRLQLKNPDIVEDATEETSHGGNDKKNTSSSLLSSTVSLDNQRGKRRRHIEWSWLVSCGEIFLIHYPKDDLGANTKVFLGSNHNLVELIGYLLMETKRKVGDDMLNADEMILQRSSLALTPHGHLQILDAA